MVEEWWGTAKMLILRSEYGLARVERWSGQVELGIYFRCL